MGKTFGWAGKILWVDLTKGKIKTVPLSDFEPGKYIGGVGLNSRIFWELGAPKVAAFHPDNPLLISVGPLTGAPGPFNRAEVSGIAPQSYPQELFAYSGLGGKFPSELKYAGYDGIVILGKSEKPVYLLVEDETVAIRDAKHLWGLDTFETQKALAGSHQKAAVLAIGPAGENMCRFAIILNVYERAEHLAAWVQNHQSLKNSLPICEYASMPETYYHPPGMDIQMFESKILSAITGTDYSVARLREAGERIWNLRRTIMVIRENRGREGDTISHVWFERRSGDPGSLAAPLDRKQWDELITRYYKLRGWSPQNGHPTRAKLDALGMNNIADKISA